MSVRQAFYRVYECLPFSSPVEMFLGAEDVGMESTGKARMQLFCGPIAAGPEAGSCLASGPSFLL